MEHDVAAVTVGNASDMDDAAKKLKNNMGTPHTHPGCIIEDLYNYHKSTQAPVQYPAKCEITISPSVPLL